MVHFLFLLKAKLISTTKVKTSMSQKWFPTMKQKTKKVLFEHFHIKPQKILQPTKKMECPVTFQTKKILSFPEFSVNKDIK